MNFASSDPRQIPFMVVSELVPFFSNNKVITDFTNIVNNRLYPLLRDQIKERADKNSQIKFPAITAEEIKSMMDAEKIDIKPIFAGYDKAQVEKIEFNMLDGIAKYINALADKNLNADSPIHGANLVVQNAQVSGVDYGHAGMFNIIALLGANADHTFHDDEKKALKNLTEQYFPSMEKIQAAMKLYNADNALSELKQGVNTPQSIEPINISDWMIDGKRNPNFVIALTNTRGNVDGPAFYSDLLVSAQNIARAVGNIGFTEEECTQIHKALVNECIKMPNMQSDAINGKIAKQNSAHGVVKWAKSFDSSNMILSEQNVDIEKISSFCDKLISAVKIHGNDMFKPTVEKPNIASKSPQEQSKLLITKLESIKEEAIERLTESRQKSNEKVTKYEEQKAIHKQSSTNMDLPH